jgi:hypothetical protein
MQGKSDMSRFLSLSASAISVLLLSALTVPASVAQGPGDRDGHGGGARALLDLDSNGDRQLTRAELSAGLAARYAAIDTNKDGVVPVAEFKAHADARRSEMEAGRTKLLDTNGDGQVSDTEKAAAPKRGRGGERRDMVESADRIDADKDGKITLAEFSAPMDKVFAALDANGDGAVSATEVKAGRPDRKR